MYLGTTSNLISWTEGLELRSRTQPASVLLNGKKEETSKLTRSQDSRHISTKNVQPQKKKDKQMRKSKITNLGFSA